MLVLVAADMIATITLATLLDKAVWYSGGTAHSNGILPLSCAIQHLGIRSALHPFHSTLPWWLAPAMLLDSMLQP